jgi:hypothetical protein
MRWGLGLLLAGCVTTPAPLKPVVKAEVAPPAAQVDPQAELRAVVNAFVTATEARRFDRVLALLSKPLRDRYSVKALERDFGDDPLAPARLTQLKLKAGSPLLESKSSASLEWSAGRALRLVHEPDGWRITALE